MLPSVPLEVIEKKLKRNRLMLPCEVFNAVHTQLKIGFGTFLPPLLYTHATFSPSPAHNT